MIRAGLLRLGAGMPGEVLSGPPGSPGPQVPCDQGHEAVFVGYRDKTFDTVLGPVAYVPLPITARPAAPRMPSATPRTLRHEQPDQETTQATGQLPQN